MGCRQTSQHQQKCKYKALHIQNSIFRLQRYYKYRTYAKKNAESCIFCHFRLQIGYIMRPNIRGEQLLQTAGDQCPLSTPSISSILRTIDALFTHNRRTINAQYAIVHLKFNTTRKRIKHVLYLYKQPHVTQTTKRHTNSPTANFDGAA